MSSSIEQTLLCNGCKWLDTRHGNRKTPKGYCCHVERSSQRKVQRETKFGVVDAKVRDETTPRCELYEAGDFATRYITKVEK